MTLSRHFLCSLVFVFVQETVNDSEAGGWAAVLRVQHSVDCGAEARAGKNKTQAKRRTKGEKKGCGRALVGLGGG